MKRKSSQRLLILMLLVSFTLCSCGKKTLDGTESTTVDISTEVESSTDTQFESVTTNEASK